jgi:phosphoglycerol transferase
MNSYPLISLMVVAILVSGCAAKDDSSPTASKTTESTTVLDTGDFGPAITFREVQFPQYVKSISGLAGAESFGRWSEQKVVTIQFNKPLPKTFTLVISAGAYGDNRKNPAVIRAGTQERKLLIDATNAEPRNFSVDFTDVENTTSITIEVPNPTIPKSIGQGEDIRALGYNFVTLSIRPSELN